MELTLCPRTRLHESLCLTLLCSTPSCTQLALAGYGLTAEQQQQQQCRKHLGLFPTSPLVSAEELRAGQSAGVRASQAFHDWKALRSFLTIVSDITQRIGTGTPTGYNQLTYLSARGITPMSTRYNQQAELLRALKDAKLDQFFKAAMEGQLLLSEDVSKNGSSTLSTPATTMLVCDLLSVPGRWSTMHQTKLHVEWRDQDLVCKPGFITIQPAQLEVLDDIMFQLVQKFLPSQFFNVLEQKFRELKFRRISSLGLLTLVFGEDQSLPELTAAADRQTFEDTLSTPWLHRETALEFRLRHDKGVADYNQFSEVPRFTNSDLGTRERIEFILQRLRKGQLKNIVTAEWDLLKLKEAAKSRPQPGLEQFWGVVEFQYKVIENKEARELSLVPAKSDDKSGKRKFPEAGEQIYALTVGTELCRHFQAGKCHVGAACKWLHSPPSAVRTPVITSKGNGKGKGKDNLKGKGKGKGWGKPSLREGDKGGKGQKGDKGGKGKKGEKGRKGDKGQLASILKTVKTGSRWTGKGQPPGTGAVSQHCARCQLSHYGNVGNKCMRAPCRYCTAEGLTPTDHSLFYCTRKPITGQRDTEPLRKKVKFNAMDQINSLTAAQYREMEKTFDQVNAVRALITNGENSVEGHASEQIRALTAQTEPPQLQVAPYAPTKPTLTLTATRPKQSDEAKLREAVKAVTLARRADGHDGKQRSLTELEPVPASAKVKTSQFGTVAQGAWNGMPEGEQMRMLVEYEDPADEQLFRRQAVGGHRVQPETTCCPRLSGGLASFFEENNFSNFHLLPLLLRTDGVCGSNGSPDDASALSDTSEESILQQNIENSQFEDAADWIAQANGGDSERYVLGVEPSAPKPSFGPVNNPYVQILQTELDANQQIYMFDKFRQFRADHYPTHIDVMGDVDADGLELINQIMADDGQQTMVDSGASSSIVVMGKGRKGVFRCCSKLTPTRTNFSTYGGNKADIDIRGWAWVSWTFQCDLTHEMVVVLARTYIAVDPSGRFRSIWSPGTMKHHGFVFLQGVPANIHVTGSEYSFNLTGPSTDSYIFDSVGHCFECPTVGRGKSLQVLKDIDFGDTEVMDRVDQLTQEQISLLVLAGAHRDSDGVCGGSSILQPRCLHARSSSTAAGVVARADSAAAFGQRGASDATYNCTALRPHAIC